jgi:ribosomal protein S18 acetylase RimI-like enzyme
MKPVFTLADTSQINLVIELMREFYIVERLNFDEQVARRALQQILSDASLGQVHLIGTVDEVIGYIVLTFGFSLEFHGRDALIDEFYLRESYRGRGIGKATLQFIHEVCRSEGIKALNLEVDKENTRAQAIYQQAGYLDRGNYLLTKWLEEK